MLNALRQSISKKFMLVVMATTFVALLVYGFTLLFHDIQRYHDSLIKDLETQAGIIAEVSTAALEFNAPVTANENLGLLRTRPGIIRAAIFLLDGTRFADYRSQPEVDEFWPAVPLPYKDHTIVGRNVNVWRPVVHDGQMIGSVYIQARYEIGERMLSYAIILLVVMAACMGLAALIAIWLRGAITRPILAVTDVARKVMETRDYSLRVRKFTEDEIGVLVDAFNDMLSEVERRAIALETFNRSLEREMTERLAAENALRQADRRKDEFLATLAHELRNPLAPLLNSLRILRDPETSAETTEYAKLVMGRQLEQMVRLVDDLLDVSRIATGKLAISKTAVDVRVVMDAAIESSRALLAQSGHEFEVHYPEQEVVVEADSLRLAQVFSNLLNNAAKYTPGGGRIRFLAKVAGDELVLQVIDNGIGIEPNKRELIFGMFTQIDNTVERAYAGLGVGLALSKRLIAMHGGRLEVHSPGPGQGSTFSVYLKRTCERAATADAPPMDADRSCGNYRILLVDDNADYIQTLEALLTGIGEVVLTAFGGEQALAVVDEFRPTHIFMDIGMPGMTGYEVARRLRAKPEFDAVVLVAVTGWGGELDRRRSHEAGFDRHLVKPIKLEQVLDALRDGRATQAPP